MSSDNSITVNLDIASSISSCFFDIFLLSLFFSIAVKVSNNFIGTAFNVETNLLIGAAMVDTNFDNSSSLGGRSARILISLLDNN